MSVRLRSNRVSIWGGEDVRVQVDVSREVIVALVREKRSSSWRELRVRLKRSRSRPLPASSDSVSRAFTSSKAAAAEADGGVCSEGTSSCTWESSALIACLTSQSASETTDCIRNNCTSGVCVEIRNEEFALDEKSPRQHSLSDLIRFSSAGAQSLT